MVLVRHPLASTQVLTVPATRAAAVCIASWLDIALVSHVQPVNNVLVFEAAVELPRAKTE